MCSLKGICLIELIEHIELQVCIPVGYVPTVVNRIWGVYPALGGLPNPRGVCRGVCSTQEGLYLEGVCLGVCIWGVCPTIPQVCLQEEGLGRPPSPREQNDTQV